MPYKTVQNFLVALYLPTDFDSMKEYSWGQIDRELPPIIAVFSYGSKHSTACQEIVQWASLTQVNGFTVMSLLT